MDRYEAERLMLALAESTVPEGGSLHEPFEHGYVVLDADGKGVASFMLGTSSESPEVFCVWEHAQIGNRTCHVSPEASFVIEEED